MIKKKKYNFQMCVISYTLQKITDINFFFLYSEYTIFTLEAPSVYVVEGNYIILNEYTLIRELT